MTEHTILRVDASMRKNGSASRKLTDQLIGELQKHFESTFVITRDLADGVPFVDAAWIEASFTSETDRTAEQQAILAVSDQLVDELMRADTVVIGVPIYNFGVPAALKAWVDMVARARLTFQYTDAGPKGLLSGRKAYLVIASGGTVAASNVDFATGYMRHVLGFLGIHDVDVIDASGQMRSGEDAVGRARAQIRHKVQVVAKAA